MNEEISIEYEGKLYTASYAVFGDTLKVKLPNGSIRTTELRGLDPGSAADTHLRMYLRTLDV